MDSNAPLNRRPDVLNIAAYRFVALDDLPNDQSHDPRDHVVLDPEGVEEERAPPLSASADEAPF